MRRILRYVMFALLAFAAFCFVNNTNVFSSVVEGRPVLLAHRGVHQTFHREGLASDSCTATMIHPPTHSFIENTLPSMRAAFDAGADVVEFDIHPTTDGHFAVLHDWTLDCRTDGKGVTREHALADLKNLDVGYGYTADDGKTYPLRGKGVGLMPTLDEVLASFSDKRFFIHIKSRDRSEGDKLAARLKLLPAAQRAHLVVYGATEPVEEVKRQLADLRVGSRGALVDCLLRYIATGWSGYVPQACRGRIMMVPVNIAPWLWGWPNRFIARMGAADSQVFILGHHDGGNFSTGIDTPEDLARLPKKTPIGIWTNRIESIAPLAR